MPDQSFAVRDAVNAYNVQVDLIMKFFAFLQVVSVAVAGFMWTSKPGAHAHWPVACAFILFAVGNGVLLSHAYRVCCEVARVIEEHLATADDIQPKLRKIAIAFRPYPAWQIVGAHVFVDIVTLAAIVKAP